MAGEQEVVVLFTDISGYTKFVSEKGSTAGAELVRRHDSIIKPILAQFGGVYVKGTGDGLIAYFELPHQAVLSAVKIQEALAAYNLSRHAEEQVHIKIGLQIGPAVIQEGEIIGHAVNFASRLVGVCQPDQIIIGNELHKRLKRIRHITFKRIGATTLQGIPKPEDVFEVGWHFETLEQKQKGAFLPEGTGRFAERASSYYKLAAGLLVMVLVATAAWFFWPPGTEGPPAQGVKPAREAPPPTPPLPPEKRLLQQALESELTGDDEQALAALNESIRANPEDPEPYFRAAHTCYQDGQDDLAKDYLKRAREYSRLWSHEFSVKAEALELVLDGQQLEALKKYTILAKEWPRNADYQFYIGDLALDMGRTKESAGAIARCIAIEPLNPFCWFDQMVLNVHDGRFDATLETYDSLRRRNLTYPWFEKPVGYAYLGKGDLTSAREHFRTLGQAQTRLHGKSHFRTGKDGLADVAFYEGKVSEAESQLDRAIQNSDSRSERADYQLFIAETRALVGKREPARVEALKATKEFVNPLTFIDAARVLAIVGDRRAVGELLTPKLPNGELMGKIGPSNQNFVEGSLDLAESKMAEAVKKLEASYEDDEGDDLTAYMLARAYLADRQSEHATALFETIIKRKGGILIDESPLVWVLAQYDLARCYDGQGKFDDARKWYSNFVEVWKSGDSDLPQVVHAKRRLNELRKLQ
jgi:class 3 adenylate cyclase/predicted Zn-dependent protease